MTDGERTTTGAITWVIDPTEPYCFVNDPATLADFEATVAILESGCTIGEFIDRMAARDPDVLESIFGAAEPEELRRMANDGDIAALDDEWSPDGISSWNLVPDNDCLFGEHTAPPLLADLFIDDASTKDGWQFRYIPFERRDEVVQRLRSAGIAFVERPGAVFKLAASVRGGDLR